MTGMSSTLDHPRRRAWLRAGAAALAALTLPLRAQIRVEGGHVFPAVADIGGQTLQLNGAGYRAVAWFKGYAAALYLPRKTTDVDDALAQTGPKRIQMKMLVDVSTQEFVKAFGKGVTRNTPAEQLPALRERMRQFDALVGALGQVRRGDLVDLDFLPGVGLVFSYNGRAQGEPIPGADLYAALLRIFVGQRPVDKELKAGMLGGPLA